MKTLYLILFFLDITIPGWAQLPPDIYSNCDFCMCSMGISPLCMNGSAVRFDTRYTELGQEYSSGAAAPNPTHLKETYLTNVLSLTGQLAEGLSGTLMIPFAHKLESSIDPSAGLASSISNAGIGDMSLLFRYNVIADHEWVDMRIVSVTGGVKFSNGSTSLLDQGDPADPDVQLGTGTTDFFAGVSGLFGFDDWNIEADALVLLRGFGNGANGHTYGDNVNYDLTASYRVYENAACRPTLLSPSLFAAFGIRGEWRGYEEQSGQPLNNDAVGWSGGNVVYAAPGFELFLAPRVSIDASVWIPFIHALNGNQLGETLKAMAGIRLGL